MVSGCRIYYKYCERFSGDLNLNPVSNSILSYNCYFLSECGLNKMNALKNAHGRKLDVVLVSECISDAKVLEMECFGLVPRQDAYHPPLEISVPLDYNL